MDGARGSRKRWRKDSDVREIGFNRNRFDSHRVGEFLENRVLFGKLEILKEKRGVGYFLKKIDINRIKYVFQYFYGERILWIIEHAEMARRDRTEERRDGSSTSAFMICLHGSPSMRCENPPIVPAPNSDPRLIVVASRSPITRYR